jgi:O-acetyl-ADP-ribose deacetylase (regulator of RNase III)
MIIYLAGDATRPQYGGGERFILHVCNVVGGWGAGFTGALSRRWDRPEAAYREWHRTESDIIGGKFELGSIQPVRVEPRTIVVNMLAQKFIGRPGPTDAQDEIPLSYEALGLCLSKVKRLAGDFKNTTIHAPKFGAGLAGGEWTRIAKLIDGVLKEYAVYIYNYPGSAT